MSVRLPASLPPQSLLARTARAITPVDPRIRQEAHERQQILTKPEGSLGLLETLSEQLCAIYGQVPGPIPSHPVVGLFAGDHGVCAQGVSPDPQEITYQQAINMAAGGAGVGVLTRQMGGKVIVTDVGILKDLPAGTGVVDRKIQHGTDDISVGPAMSLDDAVTAFEVGIQTGLDAIDEGADTLVAGEMGIGNTTPAAALIALFTGKSAKEVTGHGAGADERRRAHKIAVVDKALTVNEPDAEDPVTAMALVGGFELAAMAGLMLAGASRHVPVIIDGVLACSAALTATAIAPATLDYLVAGHAGAEPGIVAATEKLGLPALLDLGMRLGEGSGAILAFPIVQAAAHIMAEMTTFDEVGVTDVKVTGETDFPGSTEAETSEDAAR